MWGGEKEKEHERASVCEWRKRERMSVCLKKETEIKSKRECAKCAKKERKCVIVSVCEGRENVTTCKGRER